jgi:sulfur carrier protein ThiS adenylyltransferase
MRIHIHHVKLDEVNTPIIFEGCHAIVETVDSPEMKEILIETVYKKLPRTPLVVGSGLAGWGKTEILKSKKIDEILYVCGDELSEESLELPILAPRLGIVACMQANTVIEILLNKIG